jgi:hypothetical protein
MRGDVRRAARRQIERECPDCGAVEYHTLVAAWPATATTGAWGKYLNPAYLCHGCKRVHTLLCYETDRDADRPEWGGYPPNQSPTRHLTPREKLQENHPDLYAEAGGER